MDLVLADGWESIDARDIAKRLNCSTQPILENSKIWYSQKTKRLFNKSERTKNRILDAAMALFCEKGYVAVTITAIKEATDLSIGGV